MSRSITSYALKGAALVLLVLLARKALVDTDLFNYDSLTYHLPFAARLWGIASKEQFICQEHIELVYTGFPLLGEFLQGMLWRLFAHIQAANLVALSSLLLYCWFARAFLEIPWHLTFLALVAVPLVQIHATGSLVDLPANLATAAVVLVTYRVYAGGADPPRWREIVALAVAAAISVNTKFLHTGVVALALVAVGARLVWLSRRSGPGRRPLAGQLAFLIVAAPLIFATPIKNTALYGNPLYPIQVSLPGLTLPHAWVPRSTVPSYLLGTPQPVRWLLSIFEFRAFDARRPYPWTGDQGYVPAGVPANRMGGYFFPYVTLNLLCFGFLIATRRTRETRLAAGLFALLTVITAVQPQSHELRYYMYWIVVLISLNLHFLATATRSPELPALPLTAEQYGVACLVFVAIVAGLSHGAYLRSTTQPVMIAYTSAIEPAIRAGLEKSAALCVVGRTNSIFLYADIFHAPLRYSVKAARTDEQCGSRVVVPAR